MDQYMTRDFNGNEIKPGDKIYYQAYNALLTVKETVSHNGCMVCYHPELGSMMVHPLDCEKVS